MIVYSAFGAGGGGRTRTLLPGLDFESSTSANSITPAYASFNSRDYYTITTAQNQEFLQFFIYFTSFLIFGCNLTI